MAQKKAKKTKLQHYIYSGNELPLPDRFLALDDSKNIIEASYGEFSLWISAGSTFFNQEFQDHCQLLILTCNDHPIGTISIPISEADLFDEHFVALSSALVDLPAIQVSSDKQRLLALLWLMSLKAQSANIDLPIMQRAARDLYHEQ